MAPRPVSAKASPIVERADLQEGWRLLAEAVPPSILEGEPLMLRHPDPPLVWRRDFGPALGSDWHALDLGYGPAGVVDARLILTFEDGSRQPQHLAKTARNQFRALFRPVLPLTRIEVEVSGTAPLDAPLGLALRTVSPWERRQALLRRALDVFKGDPRSFPWRAARFAVQLQRRGRSVIPLTTASRSAAEAYAIWRDRFDERPEDIGLHRARIARLRRRPLFSIIADPDIEAAEAEALARSLEAQAYGEWDLSSPYKGGADHRIRAMPNGTTRAERINAALADARGDFVFLPRPGTRLRPHALATFAVLCERCPDAAILSADDDDLLGQERAGPRFKPAWSPVRALSWDYLGDPYCVALDRLRAAGGVIEAGRPAQRHDLLLRVTRDLPPQAVVHVAQVLSHTTPYARASSTPEDRMIVRGHVERPDGSTHVLADPRSPHPRVVPDIKEPPLVSLIMPTRDRADLLRLSVGSIRAKTAYKNYEIIVVDNGSRDAETLQLFESWASDRVIRVMRDDGPFNYAALNNRAAAAARGRVLCLVNNDVEVLDAGWLGEMVGWAMRPGTGCVGAKLYYPDGRLQHGGVVTGIAGAAGHRLKRSPRAERGSLDDLVTVNEVSAVTAACLVIRKDIYAAVGGLDETAFAVAYNDVDFCLKVIAAGYRNLWTPFAELNHHESVSRGRDLSPKAAVRFNKENFALRMRWGDRLLADPYQSPNLTLDAENASIRTQ